MTDGPDWPDADELAESKQELREELLQRRRVRSSEAIDAARRAVTAVVLERFRQARWRCVAAFLPLRTEPASLALLSDLRSAGAEVLVPVTLADRDLDWMLWPGETLLGKDAVARADVVLVPALAVAADGTRLGRGGGSYDRALRRVRDGVPLAAVIYDEEIVVHLPRAEWDTPVTVRVTPRQGWVPLG